MTSNNCTTKLKEKIYFKKNNNDNKEILKIIYDFFLSLYKRKRYVPFEGGLQASFICLNDSFAAKICEDDGKEPHTINEYNLYNFLNNNYNYINFQELRKPSLYINNLSNIGNNGFSIRIISGDKTLMLAVISNISIESEFQLNILKKIIIICNKLLENHYYENIEIGIHTKNIFIEFDDNKNKLNEILKILQSIQEKKLLKKVKKMTN